MSILIYRRRRRATGGGGGSTTVVSDTFTRTAASLGTADTGQAWTVSAGTWSTNGTQATSASVTTNAVIDSATANRTISVALASIAGPGGLTFMYADINNHYRFYYSAGGPSIFLQKVLAGAVTNPIILGQTLSANDVLKVIVSGGLMTLQVNNVTISGGGSLTPDAGLAANTKDGMFVAGSTGVAFDNYLVTAP